MVGANARNEQSIDILQRQINLMQFRSMKCNLIISGMVGVKEQELIGSTRIFSTEARDKKKLLTLKMQKE